MLFVSLDDVCGDEDHEDSEYNFMAEDQKEEKEEYRNDRAVRIPSKLHCRSSFLKLQDVHVRFKLPDSCCAQSPACRGYRAGMFGLCCSLDNCKIYKN